MDEIAKEINDLAEYGQLHNDDCCVHFPEDARACDVSTPILGCCENMEILGKRAEKLVEMAFNYVSHDINFKTEAQRKNAVKMYMDFLKEELNK